LITLGAWPLYLRQVCGLFDFFRYVGQRGAGVESVLVLDATGKVTRGFGAGKLLSQFSLLNSRKLAAATSLTAKWASITVI
jgi:hypothetical protein